MSGPPVLDRNLLALSAYQPHLVGRLRTAAPSAEAAFLPSRSGPLVPARLAKGRATPLHSTVDPLREGRRYLDLYAPAGYLVFLGLGGGFQVSPFLSAAGPSRLLILETDASFFRAVLEHIDLCPILTDPRVRLELDQSAEGLREFLLSDYLPAVHGDLRSVPLQAAVHARQDYYGALADSIQAVIGSIADDYTVQAHFGRRWFVNTLANLPAAQESTVSVPPFPRALVVGAGPSLEQQVQRIPELRRRARLIASDTSLPALLAYGVTPDLVISIDCQQVSYHHFLQGFPAGVPLVLDLASPPALTRLGAPTLFFASGHPLSRLLSARWRPLPSLDASGGNVSHAAVSLALFLGAREIYLLGTDFSYPEGKAYCRGTYIYPLFQSTEHRLRPLEARLFSFILKNSTVLREPIPGGFRYLTRPLSGYRERLEGLLGGAPARVVALPGKGAPLRLPPGEAGGGREAGRLLAAGAPRCHWRAFLQWYAEGLQGLPEPSAPVSRYLAGLSEEQRGLWATLLPAAAAFREGPTPAPKEARLLLEEVRDWSVRTVRRFLDR